ncbi:unnamed protein product, partial [Prorocentrum cordatum]
MFDWEVTERHAAFSSCFFLVDKASGVNLRLAFDARVANLSFAALPFTRLPTLSAWSALEVSRDDFVAQGDIQCAFYHTMFPPHLIALFAARGRGFLRFWYSTFAADVIDAGIGANSPLVDGAEVPPLREDTDVVAAGCVDSFATVFLDPGVAAASCQAVRAVLAARGHAAGEFAPAAQRVAFTGLGVLGDLGVIRCKGERLCWLRQALLGLPRRGFASPPALPAGLGRCAWGAGSRAGPRCRSVHAVCRFMGSRKKRAARWWVSVVADLRAAAALAPLWQSNVKAEWAATASCSDSSPYGIGVYGKARGRETAVSAGRLPEGRPLVISITIALHDDLRGSAAWSASTAIPAAGRSTAADSDFDEVPEAIAAVDGWTTIHPSRRSRLGYDVVRSEAE